MNMPTPTYNWKIDEQESWPPHERPHRPFGPTALEVMRSCPLRSCFEATPSYERRTGFAARVGIAFHRALQSLSQDPPADSTNEQVAEEARRRFLLELKVQEEQKALRAREQRLPWNEERINRAIEAIMIEALRIAQAGAAGPAERRPRTYPPSETRGSADGDAEQASRAAGADSNVEAEVPIRSKDGLFHGRVDCAEHSPQGTRLIDYKSALRDDLPERYERQLQLYALLWHETRGEWPVAAEVVYPFTGVAHEVHVDPDMCTHVGEESREIVARVHTTRSPDKLATPGDVCQVCEFRPWCQPFWLWQASESNHTRALERATRGLEGEVVEIATINGYWRLIVRWRGCMVRIVAPLERFPQLHNAQPGTRVRALDMRLQGQPYQPQAVVTDYSELFLMS
jgi:PD-(D/E)XK nuclease superfamily